MEPLFTSNAHIDFYEYRKFSDTVFASRKNIIFIIVIAVAYFILGFATGRAIWFLCAPLFVGIFLLVQYFAVKRTYNKTKFFQDLDFEYKFYEDYFTAGSEKGVTKTTYGELYDIIETKTHFYIMIGPRQGNILVKPHCSPELCEFLSQKKKEIRGK